jgi:hypothetical protein
MVQQSGMRRKEEEAFYTLDTAEILNILTFDYEVPAYIWFWSAIKFITITILLGLALLVFSTAFVILLQLCIIHWQIAISAAATCYVLICAYSCTRYYRIGCENEFANC